MKVSRIKEGRLSNATKSEVRLIQMTPFFSDKVAMQKRMKENPKIYEVHEAKREGLSFAVTTIFPGKIGREFFMTRGHAHRNPDPEIYHVLSGKGLLLCEDESFQHALLEKGCVAYVPGFVRHRTVNVGTHPFIFLTTYATDAGHDYGYVETHGFSKIVVTRRGGWRVEQRVGKKI